MRYTAPDSRRLISLVCAEDDVGSPLSVVLLTKGWFWRIMAARRADALSSLAYVEADGRRVGVGVLERRDVKRLTRKLNIILTSRSRSQYSRSRAASSAVARAVAVGSGWDVSITSASSGSSSIPHNDASLYVCDVCCVGNVAANCTEAGEGAEGWELVGSEDARSVATAGVRPAYSGAVCVRWYVENAPGCSES